MREIEISMTMMSRYIISSWVEHLKEAEDGMGDRVGWLGGRWGVTLYFLSIVKFSCAGRIRRRGGLPRCKSEGVTVISCFSRV